MKALANDRAARRGLAVLAILAVHGLIPTFSQAAVPAIAAGFDRSCAVNSAGGASCWGDDRSGALGHGTAIFDPRPATVSGLSSGVAAVASSSNSFHTCAITTGGAALCWGNNGNGQLGNGTIADSAVPAPVSGLAGGVAAMATGTYHSCALTTAGNVLCWGYNRWGQVGTGTAGSDVLTPVPVASLSSRVVSLSAGESHTCAVTASGSVLCWGLNEFGQLGNGTRTSSVVPVAVAGLPSNVVAVAAGEYHTCALTSAGAMLCWGYNEDGELGNGSTSDSAVPVPVSGLSAGVAQMSLGNFHSCALLASGAVRCWGYNSEGQLGNGGSVGSATPVAVTGLASGVRAIAAGSAHTCALMASGGQVMCWGYNGAGQFGNGTQSGSRTPVAATGLTGPLASLTAGNLHTCGLDAAGRALCWGSNIAFQLGNGQAIGISTPTAVTGLTSGVAAITVGGAHACALTEAGRVLCWGYDALGQLGDGGFGGSSSLPVPMGLSSGVAAISAGSYHTCALTSAGTVYCWGGNGHGQLGNGTTADSSTPVAVTGLGSGARAIAAGNAHTCAISAAGQLLCWGYNAQGQLGTGSTTSSSVPVAVAGLSSGVAAVAAGGWHTCALNASGGVSCWGSNAYGQLGTGTPADSRTPAAVRGLSSGIAAVSTGLYNTCAVSTAGGVWCWGSNAAGQLANGLAADSNAPVAVAGLSSGFTRVAVGRLHACALSGAGTVACWGYNSSGGLGDATFATRGKPAAVVREGGAGSLAANDWFLDLAPAIPKQIPSDRIPAFLAKTSGNAVTAIVDARSTVSFRSPDVGTSGSVYVFALAPADLVRAAADGSAPFAAGKAIAAPGEKADVACVLAQLSSSGQLQAVSASSLQAYVTGVLSAQGQAVTVINGVPTASIGGATFYVGYGTSASAMLGGGVNRSVVSVPGARECKPQAPQTGWWWNPAEGGRGYSIEARGTSLFMASYLYDVSGRATWHVAAGPTSLDGSLFSGTLMSFGSGVTLSGPYKPNTRLADAGPITLAFDDATHGTLVWPGGTVALERYAFGAGGADTPALANQPESGWWWGGAADDGRGFFVEWQGGRAFLAGYMYDASGNPVWYVADSAVTNAQSFAGTWLQFANGQTLTGAWRAPTLANGNVAPVTIQFQGADSAILTLPSGTLPLTRFRF
jgi:alpha-tubulin suppressor-like RCC1 family protein